MPGMPVHIWFSHAAAPSHPPPHIEEVLPEANPEGRAQIPVPTYAPATELGAGPSQFTPWIMARDF
eukprot:3689464-Prorocentrum_lima.AAC.1